MKALNLTVAMTSWNQMVGKVGKTLNLVVEVRKSKKAHLVEGWQLMIQVGGNSAPRWVPMTPGV